MKLVERLIATVFSGRSGCVGLFAVLIAPFTSLAASAQPVQTAPGLYVEFEGQAVFGASDFDVGLIPSAVPPPFGDVVGMDDGNGWGGAFALGYAWRNGWSAAIRYRRLQTDDSSGPVDPGLFVFGAGISFSPGGFPVGLPGARVEVEAETSILDIEVGAEIPVRVGHLQIYGGLTYIEIERDTAIIDDGCGCAPIAFLLGNNFRGVGPKAGFRGGVPLNATIGFVGGASAAALFGTSTFTSRLDDPFNPPFPFQAKNDRTVAVLDAQAGLAFAMGPGSLTLGYRIDAIIGALDTDQRVPSAVVAAGFPAIGDRRDDFIAHGPFARFTLPLAGISD